MLLDENIDIRFKKAFDASGHAIFTVQDMQWKGVKNGALLKLMAEHEFDVFIAVDKNLPYQQNLTLLPVTIFILNVWRNVLPNLIPFVAILVANMQQPMAKEVFLLDPPL